MSSKAKKAKGTLVGDDLNEDPLGDDGDQRENAPQIPDWRREMREEIRSALSEFRSKRPLDLPLGPTEIDASDVLESEPFVDVMRQIKNGNRANKTAIRLAGISKEGNKQQFLDMIEIRDEIEKAQFSLKESIVVK